MVYSFCDYKFEYNSHYGAVEKYCQEYADSGKPDVSFSTFSDEYIKKVNVIPGVEYKMSQAAGEIFAFHHKIACWLPERNAFVFHAALIDVDGSGVAFAAHSGTGKSTHMALWQELLGDRMIVVNGDKPMVRFFEGEPYAYGYGTPWCGKERLGTKTRTPIKHICFIERAVENSCVKLKKEDVLDRIFDQVYMAKEPMAVMATLSLIDRFIKSVDIWQINCNMDISAAKVAYSTIFGKGDL